MTRRIVALLLALLLAPLLAPPFAAGEAADPLETRFDAMDVFETEDYAAQDDEDIAITEEPGIPWQSGGPMPEAAYTGVAQTTVRISAGMSDDAETVGVIQKDMPVKILSYAPQWLEVVRGADNAWVRGYLPRHTVDSITPTKEGVLPYGAMPAAYTGVVTRDSLLLDSPAEGADSIFLLKEGTPLAILSIDEGWAQVQYWRQYAYVYMDAIGELTPVFDVESAEPGDMISAFITFFSVDESELNQDRITNIVKACEYISIQLDPGSRFAFDSVAGPYQGNRGFKKAMSYFNGVPTLSTGGGVCQVSSTLYNVLLCLPGGMEVLHRRAHGPNGAVYLPHGVDAAVGNEQLNLIFRNNYPFPVRIDARAGDGVLYITMSKERAVE